MGLQNPSRETKCSGVNADREIIIFPVQLTTSRIGNLTWLIHTLAICVNKQWYISVGVFARPTETDPFIQNETVLY